MGDNVPTPNSLASSSQDLISVRKENNRLYKQLQIAATRAIYGNLCILTEEQLRQKGFEQLKIYFFGDTTGEVVKAFQFILDQYHAEMQQQSLAKSSVSKSEPQEESTGGKKKCRHDRHHHRRPLSVDIVLEGIANVECELESDTRIKGKLKEGEEFPSSDLAKVGEIFLRETRIENVHTAAVAIHSLSEVQGAASGPHQMTQRIMNAQKTFQRIEKTTAASLAQMKQEEGDKKKQQATPKIIVYPACIVAECEKLLLNKEGKEEGGNNNEEEGTSTTTTTYSTIVSELHKRTEGEFQPIFDWGNNLFNLDEDQVFPVGCLPTQDLLEAAAQQASISSAEGEGEGGAEISGVLVALEFAFWSIVELAAKGLIDSTQ